MGMVIGRGIIANRFLDYSLQSSYLLFVGDINDSTALTDSDIQSEEALVAEALRSSPQAVFVYFSSCSVSDAKNGASPYVAHKLRMEKLVQGSAARHLIFRLPQVLGLSDDKNGPLNSLIHGVIKGVPIQIEKNTQCNIIDVDDVYSIVHEILLYRKMNNQVVNVASSQQTTTAEFASILQSYFSSHQPVKIGSDVSSDQIDINDIKNLISHLNIDFSGDYLRRSIDKYFRHYLTAPYLLSIIVPTFNEEHGIEEFYRRTKFVLNSLKGRFNHEIIFVNDFSTDKTFAKLQGLAKQDPAVRLINFSRNFGNQIGITAGIDYSQGDIAIIIDDDLQDPPEIMLNFIAKWTNGFKVVYGVRPKRTGVNVFFKLLAMIYYRVIGALSEIAIPNDTGDFRLIDRVVIEKLRLMKEENRYYRGMVAWVGFPQVGCLYDRDKRYAGVSTFSFKKYINFAMNGLTSFTDKPLYFSSLLGFFITCAGFCLAVSLIISKIIDPSATIRGWTSIMAITIFFGGIQLLSIGIVGIYLSKIFREVKGRPLYIVESTTNIK